MVWWYRSNNNHRHLYELLTMYANYKRKIAIMHVIQKISFVLCLILSLNYIL